MAEPDSIRASRTRLLQQVSASIRDGSIELPSLPDIAIDVRVAISRAELDINDLVKLIQQDPGLTAYLIKVSLSAWYKRGEALPSLKFAINRLGLNTTRELTMGYALRALFVINDAGIKRRMKDCWQRSVRTAAIAHVMARYTGFNPDRALLAGLLQDIGALPVLVSLKDFPDLLASPGAVEALLAEFTGKVSALVLHEWQFDNDLIVASLNRENWLREHSDSKDLADLILVARYHSYLSDNHHRTLPPLHRLPAFKKLDLGEVDPAQGIAFLKEADEEIAELQSLLR